MAIRKALRQSALLTFAAIVVFLWLLYSTVSVFQVMDLAGGTELGQTTFSGVVGIVVMLVALVLLVYFAGELSASEPTPQTWPPSE